MDSFYPQRAGSCVRNKRSTPFLAKDAVFRYSKTGLHHSSMVLTSATSSGRKLGRGGHVGSPARPVRFIMAFIARTSRTSSTLAHHFFMLTRRQRAHLAPAARSDDCGDRMLYKMLEVSSEPSNIQGQIGLKRRDGKSDHAAKPASQLL